MPGAKLALEVGLDNRNHDQGRIHLGSNEHQDNWVNAAVWSILKK